MDKSGKVWGWTRSIFSSPYVEVNHISINPDHFCSEHKHDHKYNAFYILEGLLEIVVWKNDYDLVDKTLLQPYDMMTVKPGEFHKFVNNTQLEVRALEIYWVANIATDIVRRVCGG